MRERPWPTLDRSAHTGSAVSRNQEQHLPFFPLKVTERKPLHGAPARSMRAPGVQEHLLCPTLQVGGTCRQRGERLLSAAAGSRPTINTLLVNKGSLKKTKPIS